MLRQKHIVLSAFEASHDVAQAFDNHRWIGVGTVKINGVIFQAFPLGDQLEMRPSEIAADDLQNHGFRQRRDYVSETSAMSANDDMSVLYRSDLLLHGHVREQPIHEVYSTILVVRGPTLYGIEHFLFVGKSRLNLTAMSGVG